METSAGQRLPLIGNHYLDFFEIKLNTVAIKAKIITTTEITANSRKRYISLPLIIDHVWAKWQIQAIINETINVIILTFMIEFLITWLLSSRRYNCSTLATIGTYKIRRCTYPAIIDSSLTS